LIGDAAHLEEAKAAGLDVDVMDFDSLKKFNKEKKPIKKWAKKYAVLIATDTLIRKIPVVLGPWLNRIGKFPLVVTKTSTLASQIDDVRASIKFQLKKAICLAVAVGNEDMSDEQLKQNITMALGFLVSLLKKGWHNVKSLTIKTTMSKPYRILG